MPNPQVKRTFLLAFPDGNCSGLTEPTVGSIMETYKVLHTFLQDFRMSENRSTHVECLSALLPSSFCGVKWILQCSPLKAKWKAALKLQLSNLEMHDPGNSGSLFNMMLPLHLPPNEWAIQRHVVPSLQLIELPQMRRPVHECSFLHGKSSTDSLSCSRPPVKSEMKGLSFRSSQSIWGKHF